MVAVKRVTIVIMFFLHDAGITSMYKTSYTSVCDFGRQIMIAKREIMFLKKEGSYLSIHLFGIKTPLSCARMCEVRVQTEGERVILLATTLCVLYSLKANIFFPREKLERDNLISYRTVYLTYQHILQITCKLDVPNLKSSRTNNNRRSLKMTEELVLHSFL